MNEWEKEAGKEIVVSFALCRFQTLSMLEAPKPAFSSHKYPISKTVLHRKIKVTMKAKLRQQAGEARGREMVLSGVTIIGRSERADLVLDDERASRQHARVAPGR